MKIKQYQWVLKTLFFTAFFICSQWAICEVHQKDTTAIDQLYAKSKTFWYSNHDSTLYYLKIVEELSKQSNYKRGIGYALYGYGRHEPVLYKRFQYFTQALEIFESVHDRFGVGITLVVLGDIYFQIGQNEKSLEYYKKALAVKKEIDDYGGIALTLIEIGRYYKTNGELSKALNYFNESLMYRLKAGSPQGIAYAQVNIAEVLFDQHKVDKALAMADSSVHNFSFSTDITGSGWALYIKAKSLLALKRPEEAEKIFKIIDQQPYNVLGAKQELIAIYSKRGDIQKAFQMQSEFLVIKDTLASRDYRQETQRIVNEYEFNTTAQETQRQKEMKEQQVARRNTIEYLIIAVFILIVFVILFSGKKLLPARLIHSFLFIGLLLLFEFLLVVTDPKVESLTQGEPFLKLLANLVLALLVLPAHQFLEKFTKGRLIGENISA